MTPIAECYIYVIGRHKGPVKVGITSSLGARLASIQTGCPFKIELIYARPCGDRDTALRHERMFHQVWDEARLEGEWFKLDADQAIESVDTVFEIDEAFAARERSGEFA